MNASFNGALEIFHANWSEVRSAESSAQKKIAEGLIVNLGAREIPKNRLYRSKELKSNRRKLGESRGERKPPLRWRRNMMSAVLLLAVLDFIILSGSQNTTGLSIAVIVTVAVGIVVARIWQRNVRLEKRITRAG